QPSWLPCVLRLPRMNHAGLGTHKGRPYDYSRPRFLMEVIAFEMRRAAYKVSITSAIYPLFLHQN
ncbi:MAG TPA: hypothetical protein PK011_09905, partial [Marinagarivorans sp.]|nr:hypothetical protein [Marinagarivorans sp.]